jgi:hypothetical protein
LLRPSPAAVPIAPRIVQQIAVKSRFAPTVYFA